MTDLEQRLREVFADVDTHAAKIDYSRAEEQIRECATLAAEASRRGEPYRLIDRIQEVIDPRISLMGIAQYLIHGTKGEL